MFCVPCNIFNKNSATNLLIKRGCTIILEPLDIINECKFKIEEISKQSKVRKIPSQYAEIMNLLEEGETHINNIYKNINETVSNINSKLTLMELEGIVKKLPGNIFKTASDENV